MTFKIISCKNQLFNIQFLYPNPILINSLIKTRLIPGGTSTDDYTMLTFKAYSVMMFKEANIKGIYSVANMANTLAIQLKYLIETYSHTFLGYNTENLIVIDENKFVFLDSDLLIEINETNNIMITSPFNKKDFFIYPELENIKEFPVNIHYKSSYFSYGFLLLYMIISGDDFYEDYLTKNNFFDILKKYLNNIPFKDTKLYFMICRSLVEDPENRCIVFI
jgi:hypothetical protein